MELFSYSEFDKYRTAELEEGVSIIHKALHDKHPEYLNGAMDMLRAIINVPCKLVPDGNESRKEQVKQLKARNLAQLDSKLLRTFVESDD